MLSELLNGLLEVSVKRHLACFGYFLITVLLVGKWHSSNAETEIIKLSSTGCENVETARGVSISPETGIITVVWIAFGDSSGVLPDGICTVSNLSDSATSQHRGWEHDGRLNMARFMGSEVSAKCQSTNPNDCVMTETFTSDPCEVKFSKIFACSFDSLSERLNEDGKDFLLIGEVHE